MNGRPVGTAVVARAAVASAAASAAVGAAWWLPWWLVAAVAACTTTVSVARARLDGPVARCRDRGGVVVPESPEARDARLWAADMVRDPEWWESRGCLATAAVLRERGAGRLPVHTGWSGWALVTRRDCGCEFVKPVLIHSVGWTEPCRVHTVIGPSYGGDDDEAGPGRDCADRDCVTIRDPDTGEHLGNIHRRPDHFTICTHPTRQTVTASTTMPCPGCGRAVVRVNTIPPAALPPTDHTVTGPLSFTCPGFTAAADGTIYAVDVSWYG